MRVRVVPQGAIVYPSSSSSNSHKKRMEETEALWRRGSPSGWLRHSKVINVKMIVDLIHTLLSFHSVKAIQISKQIPGPQLKG